MPTMRNQYGVEVCVNFADVEDAKRQGLVLVEEVEAESSEAKAEAPEVAEEAPKPAKKASKGSKKASKKKG